MKRNNHCQNHQHQQQQQQQQQEEEDKTTEEEHYNIIFNNLKEWIKQNNGIIHPSLTHGSSRSGNGRGIFATESISKGQVLISLPSKLSINGKMLPSTYKFNNNDDNDDNDDNDNNDDDDKVIRNASPWLRCIISLILSYKYMTKNNQRPMFESSHHVNESSTDTNNSTDMNTNIDTDTSATNKSNNVDYSPYLNSLPMSYDTLFQSSSLTTSTSTSISSWSDHEISNYLSGTTLGKIVTYDRQCNTLHTRFIKYVKPYLDYILQSDDNENNTRNNHHHNNNDSLSLLSLFEQACACVSTRGFHLQGNKEEEYSGPFLLPFIDLLNHTSSSIDKCTTLQQQYLHNDNDDDNVGTNESVFVMVAERFIQKGEEILHSYGDTLTSGQLLQTFGFVEDRCIQRAMNNLVEGNEDDMLLYNLTPAVLSRMDVIQACSNVSSSLFPNQLKQIIHEKYKKNNHNNKKNIDNYNEDVDETWDLPQSVSNREKDVRNIIPDEILIQYEKTTTQDTKEDKLLCDELVTLCSIQFLPDDVYADWLEENGSSLCMLSKDILDDYFLGKLVLKSILVAIESKMKSYEPILLDFDIDYWYNELETSSNHSLEGDKFLLQKLYYQNMSVENKRNAQQHAMYCLTIRIEEMTCLLLLKRRVLVIFDSLDDEYSEDNVDEDDDIIISSSKKIKL